MDRREFMLKGAALAAEVALVGTGLNCSRKSPDSRPQASAPPPVPPSKPEVPGKLGSNRFAPALAGEVDLAVAQGGEPAELTRTALERYGGIGTWVKPGDRVVIKPNLAYGAQPAQTANVHPQVLAAVLALCQEAAAGEIAVVEHTLDTGSIALRMSGAKEVCDAAHVPLTSLQHESSYSEVALPKALNLHTDLIATDLLNCDVYINLAVAKVHTATTVTLSVKNQLGAVWNRGRYHREGDLADNIADLAAALRPTLNIIDATRALMTNGPQGPGLVEEPQAVIVSADPVAADAYACRYLRVDPQKVSHLRRAAERGLGKLDPSSFRVAAG